MYDHDQPRVQGGQGKDAKSVQNSALVCGAVALAGLLLVLMYLARNI
jgi:hypothetical protein